MVLVLLVRSSSRLPTGNTWMVPLSEQQAKKAESGEKRMLKGYARPAHPPKQLRRVRAAPQLEDLGLGLRVEDANHGALKGGSGPGWPQPTLTLPVAILVAWLSIAILLI